MRSRTMILAGAAVALVLGGAVAARSGSDAPESTDAPRHHVPVAKDGNLVVALCDGKTTMEVQGVKEGESMSRDQAQHVADQLMDEWRQKNPDANWQDTPVQVAQAGGAAPGQGLAAQPNEEAPSKAATNAAGEPGTEGAVGAAAVDAPTEKTQTGIYSAFTSRDQKVWQDATDKFVAEGKRVFHDAKAFGGTIGVSCDMCHPDAANTHPETYPKFQVQLGRVAMLRDMINWCIENPARGKPLRDDDVRLKAMEAYILAQRKGVALDYGRH